MPVIMRTANDDLDALHVAAAFDKHAIRVVAIVRVPIQSHPSQASWRVYGQGERFDCDRVDETYDVICSGAESD